MRNKVLALVFGLLGAVVIIAGLYYALNYLGYIGNLLISFFSANSVDSINRCGLYVPQGFNEIRDQIATSILPMLYLGAPLALLVISILMFLSGYFCGKHTMEREAEARKQREEHIQREVERRMGGKPGEQPSGEKRPPEVKPAKPSEGAEARPAEKGRQPPSRKQ
ncbi:MAG: hypothetical protein AB1657_00350 [Candidatus Micrarchaeota archaeon]